MGFHRGLPFGDVKIPMENGPLRVGLPIEIVDLNHSYVELPDGK